MKMNINKIHYSHKSSTCMNKDGKALSVYDSYQEAQNSARYIGKSFIPYLCSRCGKYHLCNCVDHNGNPKDCYKTREDALKMVNIRAKAGIVLHIYECPKSDCFHLTSRNVL